MPDLMKRSECILGFLLMHLHLALHVSDTVVFEYEGLNALHVFVRMGALRQLLGYASDSGSLVLRGTVEGNDQRQGCLAIADIGEGRFTNLLLGIV